MKFSCADPRDVLTCPACKLVQYASPHCKRCKESIGVVYLVLDLRALSNSDSTGPEVLLRHLIGSGLRQLRRRHHLTQLQLARKLCCVNRSEISRIENGRVLPSLPSLVRIACELGVTEAVLKIDQWRS